MALVEPTVVKEAFAQEVRLCALLDGLKTPHIIATTFYIDCEAAHQASIGENF